MGSFWVWSVVGLRSDSARLLCVNLGCVPDQCELPKQNNGQFQNQSTGQMDVYEKLEW